MTPKTARQIWRIVVPTPFGHKMPSEPKAADRERARLIFEQEPALMQRCGFASSEELVQKYWTDPDGELPLR